MKNRWGPALLASILLIGGLELFFRFAVHSVVKAIAIALVLSGIVILGASRWERRQLPWKLLAGIVFAAYLIAATRRFPGLVKDPMPGDAATLALKGLATLVILTAAIAGGTRLLRASRRGLWGDRNDRTHVAR